MHPLDSYGGRHGQAAVIHRSFADVRNASRTAAAFGRAKPKFSLAVNLGEELLTKRWWRGVATLCLLCAGAATAMPTSLAPLRTISPDLISSSAAEELHALAIGPMDQGSQTGGRMAANALVDTLAAAPERATVDVYGVVAKGDSIARLLARNEVNLAQVVAASKMIEQAAGGKLAAGTSVAMTLGHRDTLGKRPIVKVALRSGIDLNINIVGRDGALSLVTSRLAVDSSPVRVTGLVGEGLYWSLRAQGVEPQTAAEYLRAIATQVDVGADIAPNDRFDLIMSSRKTAGGSQAGPLLYAAIDRPGGNDLRLMKWDIGGRSDWINPDGIGRQVDTMSWPVSAPITSTFGMRYHPILHFARMHKGIDFGAHAGQPIVAAADGQVERAGWAGGYGQQVRLAHSGGIETSYSHMSRMVVAPGMPVRQGQLIGYVGTTGLSTGPHLHYEVYRGGVPVNPMGVRFSSRALLEGDQLAAFKARLAALSAVRAKG
nr:M23 family metallopeptidase [uncultured Sphingomonas sp.]